MRMVSMDSQVKSVITGNVSLAFFDSGTPEELQKLTNDYVRRTLKCLLKLIKMYIVNG